MTPTAGLKLTTYGSERARAGDALLARVLLDRYARHGFRTSVLLRGIEGFGVKHRLQTERLLTLSEDLPVVSVAVDERARVEAALPEIADLMTHGLVTLERTRLLGSAADAARLPAEALHEETKLTIFSGRRRRADGRPAFAAAVDVLRRHGVAGATVLLGVDGTVAGRRERASFLSRNADVPLMTIAVGAREAIAAALGELAVLLPEATLTAERVRVLKRDGRTLAPLVPGGEPDAEREPGGGGASALPLWRKLMVYTGEQHRHEGRPLHVELVRRLRADGCSGATVLRGIWGYHGDHAPHGDRLLALRRHAPIVTVVVDEPERIARAYGIVDELTARTGLVTSERVPAFRAAHPGGSVGGLELGG